MIVSGGSAGTSEAAGITWSKHYTHLIGNAAPTHVSPRARMLFTTDATDPCLTISANGCIFSNIQIATYQASNDVLVTMTGARNYFNNVHFAGIGNATAGDDATARCFVLNDCDESRFVDCTFGLDTVARSTTNALVESVGASGSERHLFQGCRFMSYADNAGALFVKFNGAYSAERYMIFEDCIFHNSSGAGATTMTVAMDTAASLNGTVFLKNSWLHGATDWADDFTNVYLSMGKPDTDEGGIMVIAT